MIGDSCTDRRKRRRLHPIIGPVLHQIKRVGRIDSQVLNRACLTKEGRRIVNAALANLIHSHSEYTDVLWTGSLVKRIEMEIAYGY